MAKLKRFSDRFLSPSSPLTFPRPGSSLPPQLEEVFAQAVYLRPNPEPKTLGPP